MPHCPGISIPCVSSASCRSGPPTSLAQASSVNRGPWPGLQPDNAGAAGGEGVLLREQPPKEEMGVCMGVRVKDTNGCKGVSGGESELANHCTISPAHQVQLRMKRRGGELWVSHGWA